jgi:putative ABC transport system ATP-binding protein
MIIQGSDLFKTYGQGRSRRAALRGATVAVEEGEWAAVVGPSGCGKSTLLHMLGGLDEPDSGTVLLGTDDLTRMSASRRALARRGRVGFVFQAYNLIPYLDVVGNVELACRVAGERRRPARERARELLTALGLDDLASARRCPAGSSSGSPSRGRWPRDPKSCWRTSRPAPSTPTRPRLWSVSCGRNTNGGRRS